FWGRIWCGTTAPDPADQSERSVDVDHINELVVDEFPDAESKQFTAIAGATHASKGQVRLDHGRMVDEHHARRNLARHLFPVLGIGGKYGAAQTIRRVIGNA